MLGLLAHQPLPPTTTATKTNRCLTLSRLKMLAMIIAKNDDLIPFLIPVTYQTSPIKMLRSTYLPQSTYNNGFHGIFNGLVYNINYRKGRDIRNKNPLEQYGFLPCVMFVVDD